MRKLLLASALITLPNFAYAAGGCDNQATCYSAPLVYTQSANSNKGGVTVSLATTGASGIVSSGGGTGKAWNPVDGWFTPSPGVTGITAGTGLSGGTISSAGTIALIFGSTAGTAVQGNDSRLSTFTSGAPGIVPASGGGTSNFLRADGSFAVPPGTGGPGTTRTPQAITASATLSATTNIGYVVRSTAAAINVTMPPSPTDGMDYKVADWDGLSTTSFSITILPPSGYTMTIYNSNNVITSPGGSRVVSCVSASSKCQISG